jgi:catechol 2,3-dioxygenase-like lactoylglutathione lyase family enzyme|tara:strand:+ start:8589 stop:8969 length:381 start_codon:yes stop_codon:yes gene_type:complete
MAFYSHHHIHLMSHDAMQAGAFYEEMFGASITASKGANGLPRCNMELDGQTILISTVSEDVTHLSGGPHQQLGLDHLGLRVDDMNAATKELKDKGAEFIVEPRSIGPNTNIAFIRAPDGVSIELIG